MTRERRHGPLRRRVGPGLGGTELLSCGHYVAPPVGYPRTDRRRCPLCPESPRAAYYRAYGNTRNAMRRARQAAP